MIDKKKWEEIDVGDRIQFIKSMFNTGDLNSFSRLDWEIMCKFLLTELLSSERMNNDLLDELECNGYKKAFDMVCDVIIGVDDLCVVKDDCHEDRDCAKCTRAYLLRKAGVKE